MSSFHSHRQEYSFSKIPKGINLFWRIYALKIFKILRIYSFKLIEYHGSRLRERKSSHLRSHNSVGDQLHTIRCQSKRREKVHIRAVYSQSIYIVWKSGKLLDYSLVRVEPYPIFYRTSLRTRVYYVGI